MRKIFWCGLIVGCGLGISLAGRMKTGRNSENKETKSKIKSVKFKKSNNNENSKEEYAAANKGNNERRNEDSAGFNNTFNQEKNKIKNKIKSVSKEINFEDKIKKMENTLNQLKNNMEE